MDKKSESEQKRPGPKPDHLKIEVPWEKAVKKALEKRPDPAKPSDQPADPDQPGQDEPPEKDGG